MLFNILFIYLCENYDEKSPSNLTLLYPIGSYGEIGLRTFFHFIASSMNTSPTINRGYLYVTDENIYYSFMHCTFFILLCHVILNFLTDNLNLQEHRWKKRGLSIVPLWYGLSYPSSFRYGILVAIYEHDGTVAVSHGGIEMGQGINTKVSIFSYIFLLQRLLYCNSKA